MREILEDNLSLYADNIYNIPDFEKFFSRFCAGFFETPETAIQSLAKIGYGITEGAFWDDYNVRKTSEDLADPASFSKIRDFYLKTKVMPPIVPEYQFKDEVSAKHLGPLHTIQLHPGFKPPEKPMRPPAPLVNGPFGPATNLPPGATPNFGIPGFIPGKSTK